MERVRVAVLTGGSSAERGIALQSASVAVHHLDPARFEAHTIVLDRDGWFLTDGDVRHRVNLDRLTVEMDGGVLGFDVALVMIHGTPAEDGLVQGYLDLIGMPYTCSGVQASAVTFDKALTKTIVADSGIEVEVARSVALRRGAAIDVPTDLGDHLFVKPSRSGSSYGATKLEDRSGLEAAVRHAWAYDEVALVETCLTGRELACGMMRDAQGTHVFPITEIIPENAFFDYSAKYEGRAQEITPADLPEETVRRVEDVTRAVYDLLGLAGACRLDYFLEPDGSLVLVEVNTVPGMSGESILPQQAVAAGWTLERLFGAMVEEALHRSSVKSS